MKGISTIIATVLLLVITISLAGTGYVFFSGTLSRKMSEVFEIADITNEKIIIRNSGTEPITSLKAFVDDKPVSLWLPQAISPGSVGNAYLGGNTAKGTHKIKLVGNTMATSGQWEFNLYSLTDLDRDGQKEIVAMTHDGYVHIIDGATKATEARLGDFGDWISLAIADTNGDGIPNLIIADNYNTIKTYQWNGSSYVQQGPNFGYSLYSVSVGDVDSDGVIEILTPGYSSYYGVRVYGWSGSSYVQEVQINTPAYPFHVAVGDTDNDGKLNIVVQGWNNGNWIRVYQWDGSSYQQQWSININTRAGLAIADVDGDGNPEIISTGTDGRVRMYEYDGSTYTLDHEIIISGVSGYAGGMDVADWDNDNNPDIAFGDYNYVYVYEWDGSNFVRTFRVSSSSYPQTVLFSDIDNDGIIELLKGGYDYIIRVYSASGGTTPEWSSSNLGGIPFSWHGDAALVSGGSDPRASWI